LLQVLADEPEVPEAPAGTRFGDYELIERIARGGMGVVWKARKQGIDRLVALKMVHGGEFADEEALIRFRAEAEAAAGLDHPNIVPIYDVGEHDGCPWFTMRLMQGSLADQLPRERADVRSECALVATLARAVHYGHQRQVLHRDLKPGNILLDAEGTPSVSDFGTAKRLERSANLTRTGAVLGTPGYMAPEQALGQVNGLTAATDVHGLGAILYELLTGRPPFSAESDERLLRMVIEAEPARPRSLAQGIDRDVETICLKCLEKAPDRRYASAQALAEDLERYLRGENIEARAIGPTLRAWRWSGRHPVAAGTGALVLIATVTALFASLQQEERSRREILAANAYAARMAASTIVLQLRQDAEAFQVRQYADQVQRPAQDPALIAMLEGRRYDALLQSPLPVGVAMPRGLSAFDSWLVLDEGGIARARWPGGDFASDFSRRDLFLGAQALARAGKRTVHVSHVFPDERDGRARFAFSTPMFGSDGTMVGVIAALVSAEAALGSIQLNVAGRTGALIGPRDGTDEYLFLFHDGLSSKQLSAFDGRQLAEPARLKGTRIRPTGEQLRIADPGRTGLADHYLDPVPGYGGRWLAGMAPVGDTGFVVIVQTRYEVVVEPIVGALQRVGLPLVATLLVLSAALWSRRRVAGER
jgi:serine/threonine-protein kinase